MLRALCLMLLCAVPAQAQSDRVALEWERWRASQGNPDGVLVFLIGSREMLAAENGITADTPVPLASLSKAITGKCVERLVAERRLTWDTPLGAIIKGAAGDVTVGQVVSHSGGIWPDSTQRTMVRWRGRTTPRWAEATRTALSRKPQRGTPGQYAYNNENYAILGVIVEAVTGTSYTSACRSRVLTPLGITTARMSPRFGAFGPWGGWEMSVRDYARLVRAEFAGTDPTHTPHVAVGGGASYGLGMLFRRIRGSANHWHFGLLCFSNEGHGAFAVNWGGKYTIVAAYDTCVSEGAMDRLDQALARAVFAD